MRRAYECVCRFIPLPRFVKTNPKRYVIWHWGRPSCCHPEQSPCVSWLLGPLIPVRAIATRQILRCFRSAEWEERLLCRFYIYRCSARKWNSDGASAVPYDKAVQISRRHKDMGVPEVSAYWTACKKCSNKRGDTSEDNVEDVPEGGGGRRRETGPSFQQQVQTVFENCKIQTSEDTKPRWAFGDPTKYVSPVRRYENCKGGLRSDVSSDIGIVSRAQATRSEMWKHLVTEAAEPDDYPRWPDISWPRSQVKGS